MLSILPMKLFNRTKKLDLNLNIEFGKAVLSTIFVSRRKLSNHLSNPCSKRQDRNHPILSNYPVPVEKKSPYKGGTKIIQSCFSCSPTSHIKNLVLLITIMKSISSKFIEDNDFTVNERAHSSSKESKDIVEETHT